MSVQVTQKSVQRCMFCPARDLPDATLCQLVAQGSETLVLRAVGGRVATVSSHRFFMMYDI